MCWIFLTIGIILTQYYPAMHRCLANVYRSEETGIDIERTRELQDLAMKLTQKPLKGGKREPVRPVVDDAEDLYRRYLRLRAERGYFREHDDRI